MNFDASGPSEVGTPLHFRRSSINNWLESMSKRHSAATHPVLNEFISINIPDVTAKAAFNESWCQVGELVITLCVRMASAR
jgi:hypothetical protein